MTRTDTTDRRLIRTWLREFRIPLVQAFREPVAEAPPEDLIALLERADRRRTIRGPDADERRSRSGGRSRQ